MISLRQLSISVARTLADGRDAANRAALVKDLGTRFEQDSVELVADLLDYVDDREAGPLRALLAAARVHSPVYAAWRDERGAARGGGQGHGCPMNELAQLVDDLGRRSLGARIGTSRLSRLVRRSAVAQSGGHRTGPADQQPGCRTG